MKELIGKVRLKSSKVLRKITVKKVDLFDDTKIVHEFNSFFTNVGKNLASKIPNTFTSFEYFISKSEFVMKTKALSMNEMKEAFYSLKTWNYNTNRNNIFRKSLDTLSAKNDRYKATKFLTGD